MFDTFGNLIPYELIPMQLHSMETLFVTNERRETIWKDYLLFIDTMLQLKLGKFSQWIDGSFVTKKSLPNDIDYLP